MHALIYLDYARMRAAELRAEAERARLARMLAHRERGSIRKRIARALLAFGSALMNAGRAIERPAL